MFAFEKDIPAKPVSPGVTRKILVHSPKLMVCQIALEGGSAAAAHAHPHEQSTYVHSGCVQFMLGEETRILRTGDSVLIPGDVIHQLSALEDSVVLDIFTPQREDFLE